MFYLSNCPLMAWLNSSKQCHNVHCHWYQVAHQHAIWKPFLKWKAPPSWSLDNATSSPRHEPCQGTNLDQIWVGMGLGTYTWWQVMRLPFQLVSSARISWKLKPYVRIISLDIIMNVITYHCSVWIDTFSSGYNFHAKYFLALVGWSQMVSCRTAGPCFPAFFLRKWVVAF